MRKIGIMMDFAGGYGREVLRGVMRFAQLRSDWEFVMPPLYALRRKRIADSRYTDGAVAMVHDARTAEPFRRAGVPIVNTARTLAPARLRTHRIHSVVPDDEAVGLLAYRYFRDRGFGTFAFCGHPTGDWSLSRRRAFASAAEADGLRCSVIEHADEVPIEWVASLPRPVALLAANDRYAWHAIDACRAAQVRVPEDVAILGVDNDELIVDMVRPTLSSVEMPGFRIGMRAAALLAELMDGARPRPEVQVLAPESIASRGSTDVLAIEDEAVLAAVRFIRQSAAAQIRIQDVAEAVAVGRRNLERRFRRALNRSPLEEIRQAHLERARRLLRDTNLSMPAVAQAAGFSSAARFSTVFHEATGLSPSAFRRTFASS